MRYIYGVILCAFMPVIQAASLLVDDDGFASGNFSVGGTELIQMTGYLNNEFDSISHGGLTSLSTMLQYDAIWLGARGNIPMTALEIANMTAYIDTGRRVLLQAENATYFGSWNQSISQLVDGSVSSTVSTAGVTFYAQDTHVLTRWIEKPIAVGGAGKIDSYGTGTALFDGPIGGVWGDNILLMTNLNIFSDNSIDFETRDNGQFSRNVAGWLATGTVVPVPAAAWLFGSALAALGWLRKRIR